MSLSRMRQAREEQAMVKVGTMKTPAHDRWAFEQLGEGVVNSSERGAGEIHLSGSRACGDAAAQRCRLAPAPSPPRRRRLSG